MVKIDPRTRFALYAAALFVATHWPALVLPSVVPVSDKTIHFVAWGIWLALLSSRLEAPVGTTSCHRTRVQCCGRSQSSDPCSQPSRLVDGRGGQRDWHRGGVVLGGVWPTPSMWDEVGLGHSFCRLLRVGVD